MKRWYFLICTFLVLVCCKDTVNQKNIDSNIDPLNEDFQNAINAYIKENPIQLPVKDLIYKNGYSYPSYHLYFKEKGEDTILSIVQFAHLQTYDVDGRYIGKNEILYDSVAPDGFFMYKSKYPLVLFNSDKYYKPNFQLDTSIPDSLKMNKLNFHTDYVRWDFKIKDGKIGRAPNKQ